MKKITWFLIIIFPFFTYSCKISKEKKFNIDVVFPLTGNGAAASEASINAINLCVEKWNNLGGINKCLININYRDSKGQTKEAINIARKIVTLKKTNIVVSAMSSVSLGLLPILDNNDIVHLAFSGANSLLESNPQYVIRGSISPKQIGNAVISSILHDLKKQDFTIFYCNNEFGVGYLDATKEAANKNNVRIKQEIAYDTEEQTYRDIIFKSNLSNNDIIFVVGLQESLGRLIKQIRESGFKGIILCESNITSASTLAILNKDILQNTFYISLPKTDKYLLVEQSYFEKYHTKASEMALDAYNNLDLVLTVFQKSNSTNPSEVFKSIKEIKYEGLFGSTSIINQEIQYNLKMKNCSNLIDE